ncbi:MAG: hypothetical protein BWK80_23515 [Desulfobacteraceae bacterium IS3]|nr:MAG: hypothetical protein BWK80_23515 [Desulfobacteraceae bacterium IS3]
MMTACKFCGKEMIGAASCIEYLIAIEGKKYPPVPYKGNSDGFFRKEVLRCPDCNVLPGGFHHVGCSMEICPKCGGRWIYCRCSGTKVKIEENKCKIIPFKRQRKA